MNTYNTYQEAKIAMPEACICYDTVGSTFFGIPTREGTTLSKHCEFAEAKNYCMTVEKFLARNKRLPLGGLAIHEDGSYNALNDDEMIDICSSHLKSLIVEAPNLKATPEEKDVTLTNENLINAQVEIAKILDKYDIALIARLVKGSGSNSDKEFPPVIGFQSMDGKNEHVSRRCHITGYDLETNIKGQRKELGINVEQPKPKHTKEEYVKVDKNTDGGKFWECARDFAEGAHEFYFMRGNADYSIVKDNDELLVLYKGGNLRRKVVIELTEREVFVDAARAEAYTRAISDNDFYMIINALFDSGKFKLVEGE